MTCHNVSDMSFSRNPIKIPKIKIPKIKTPKINFLIRIKVTLKHRNLLKYKFEISNKSF